MKLFQNVLIYLFRNLFLKYISTCLYHLNERKLFNNISYFKNIALTNTYVSARFYFGGNLIDILQNFVHKNLGREQWNVIKLSILWKIKCWKIEKKFKIHLSGIVNVKNYWWGRIVFGKHTVIHCKKCMFNKINVLIQLHKTISAKDFLAKVTDSTKVYIFCFHDQPL